jgi:hypothetical protein
MMREYMLMAGLIGGLAISMDKPQIFLVDSKNVTFARIQDAYLQFAHLRNIPSKNLENLLSENLFILSLNWSDQMGVVGLTLAKTLIEKGANPHHPHIEEEELENKRRKMIVTHTQTAARVAKGKLSHYLKAYEADQSDQ